VDWIQLLESHDIPYVTMGPNTKRGEVSVKCPLCGDEDPSEHMGISLTSENWGCYRNAEHRGKRPHWLIRQLLGCSLAQARHLVAAYSVADPDGLDDALASLTAPAAMPKADNGPLRLPSEFQPIVNSGARARYWEYLKKRGFDPVGALTFKYNLMCATTGRWKDRIIFPLLQDGKLIGWTGRAFAAKPQKALRYLSSSDAVKKTILFEDALFQSSGPFLFLVEGPFDALKLDYYGEGTVHATCGFGTSLSIDQIAIIDQLRNRFDRLVVSFDRGAEAQAMQIAGNWPDTIVSLNLHSEIEDIGAMTRDDVKQLIQRIR
jgi:hypothetical protein